MKTQAQIKKYLSNCSIDIDMTVKYHHWGDIVLGSLTVRERGSEGKMFLYIKGQASFKKGLQPTHRRFVHMSGLEHGFYGASIETEVGFKKTGSDYKNSKRAEMFFDLIKKVIEDKNLYYVYPECEFSQIIAALEVLGCPMSGYTMCDGKDFREWQALQPDSNIQTG